MKVNHAIVANFYVANMSFYAIHENKILAKISENEFTVVFEMLEHLPYMIRNKFSLVIFSGKAEMISLLMRMFIMISGMFNF